MAEGEQERGRLPKQGVDLVRRGSGVWRGKKSHPWTGMNGETN